MENTISEVLFITVSLVITAVLISICTLFTNEANRISIKDNELQAIHDNMREERAWRKYEGQVTGADIIDFIIRHKDTCDIVIYDTKLATNNKVNTYLTSGKLLLGSKDTKNIPDRFWEASFIYDNLISGKGNAIYTATLLYDGQLVPEYEIGTQVRGGKITGIEYKTT